MITYLIIISTITVIIAKPEAGAAPHVTAHACDKLAGQHAK